MSNNFMHRQHHYTARFSNNDFIFQLEVDLKLMRGQALSELGPMILFSWIWNMFCTSRPKIRMDGLTIGVSNLHLKSVSPLLVERDRRSFTCRNMKRKYLKIERRTQSKIEERGFFSYTILNDMYRLLFISLPRNAHFELGGLVQEVYVYESQQATAAFVTPVCKTGS